MSINKILDDRNIHPQNTNNSSKNLLNYIGKLWNKIKIKSLGKSYERKLELLIESGNILEIEKKINEGVKFDDQQRISILKLAIDKEDLYFVRELINKKIKFDQALGMSILKLAIDKENLKLMKIFFSNIEEDRYFDFDNKTGVSLIHLAVSGGSKKILEFLLSKGCNPDQGDTTPIMMAINDKKIPLIKILLNHGARLGSENAEKLLSIALDAQDYELMKTSIINGAKLNDEDKKIVLNLAIFKDDLELVTTLHDPDFNAINAIKNGWSVLHWAIDKGDLKLVKYICNTKNINTPAAKGQTPLDLAIFMEEIEIVKFLSDNGAKVGKNSFGLSALHMAIKKGNLELVGVLYNGKNINAQDAKGTTPLELALLEDKPEIVKFLSQVGAKIKDNEYGWSALHWAINNGNLNLVEALCNAKDVNALDAEGRTPLELAILKGSLEIINFLSDKGAEIRANDSGWSPSHLAVASKNLDLVKALCNEKNINAQDSHGQTPLELAIEIENQEIAEFLILNQASINPKLMKKGYFPTHLGILKGNLDLVKLCYKNTISTLYDENAWTLLHHAVVGGNVKIVQFFLDEKFDVNEITYDKKTPLKLAEESKNTLLKLLIKNKIEQIKNANDQDSKNTEPSSKDSYLSSLTSAVKSKNISLIKELINKGAKFDIKSEFGYKIFNLVIDAKDMELVNYLTHQYLRSNPNALKQQTLLEKIAQISDKNINITKLVKALIEETDAKFNNLVGQKFLSKAIHANDLELIKILCSKNVKLDYKNQLGCTALHDAIKANAGEELIQFLINNINFDINIRDMSGSTLLHWAVNNHHIPAINLLLAKGAYISAIDYLHKTPLDLAKDYGYNDIVELLAEDHSGYHA